MPLWFYVRHLTFLWNKTVIAKDTVFFSLVQTVAMSSEALGSFIHLRLSQDWPLFWFLNLLGQWLRILFFL
jgi:hypothetical protein